MTIYWKDHLTAYGKRLSANSTHHASWYAIPADDKDHARLMVSQIVIDTLEGIKMSYPTTTAKRQRELKSIRKELAV